MIVLGNILEIVTDRARAFGIPAMFNDWRKLTSKLDREAVVVVSSTSVESDDYWESAVIHVNLCVPDYLGEINGIRLTQLEREAKKWSDDSGMMTGTYDGTAFTITRTGLGQERDAA